jgi:hypothetical protein
VRLVNNIANEGGGALFYVSNDMQGTLSIADSQLSANQSLVFETPDYPGVFVVAAATTVSNTLFSP